MDYKDARIKKFTGYFYLLDKWLMCKEDGQSLETFFLKYNYHSIAIYGMGILGRHLCKELYKSKIKVIYIIDQKADSIVADNFRVLSISDKLPLVDAIVVTATFAFNEIEDKLASLVPYPVVSLEEIIDELV